MQTDTEIQCVECNQMFTFTEGEANFFKEKFGDDYKQPKRCKTCRQRKKEQSRSQDARQ